MSARCGWFVLVLWCVLGWPLQAHAHDFRPGVLTVESGTNGTFRLRFVDPPGVRALPPSLRVSGGCELRGELPLATLSCGELGLRGTLHIEGLGADRPEALVHIRDGSVERSVVASADMPTVRFDSGADERQDGGFLVLGLRHIAGGIDHLLFVALLFAAVMLGPGRGSEGARVRVRELALVLTGFTLAHSLSLLAVVLGWLPPAGVAIEAWIAASLAIAAAEIVRAWRERRAARLGWGMVFVFGLVHGLGFASALVELLGGAVSPWRALLGFNLGIELGQLLFVCLLCALTFAVARRGAFAETVSWTTWPRLLPVYAVGTVAAAWTVERAFVIFG